MVSEGLAWHYKSYSDSKEFSKLEEEARQKRKGVFRQKNPTPPWEWRKKVKKMKMEQSKAKNDKDEENSSCLQS